MENSGKHYQHLNAEERAMIMLMKREGSELREIGRFWKRSSSTLPKEIAQNWGGESDYVASLAGEQAHRLRIKSRKPLKLGEAIRCLKG
ncbi:helix-turn-helix domain-containing protein [Candidatus Nitrotoga arctica]|uniref:Transposase IS30-like HTH domain-containing protein n=1 Tax=Candidatus Nitrotoga arctica TaxID=453162 RepID=A0ABM8YV02_9PROT|nr:helix-turn-helix domain-containing protein [Candidatus Nitrotoga arctica]CAG9931283.1 protein of unknown function [Candidatus Nitrotoga arctica]